ncbi:hypothetical protein D3C86_1191120 [compost metagenome]
MRVEPAVHERTLQAGFDLASHARRQCVALRVGLGLRLEDAGVAGVGGHLRRQVVDQAGVRGRARGDARFRLAEIAEVLVGVARVVLPPAQASPRDELQIVGCLEIRSRVQAEFAGAPVIAVDLFHVGHGHVDDRLVDVGREQRATAVIELLAGVAVVGAHQQAVFAAECLDGQVQVRVCAGGFPVVAVRPGDKVGVARQRINRAVGPGGLARGRIGIAMEDACLDHATALESVLHVGKEFSGFLFDAVPFRAEVGATAHVKQRAIGIGGQAECRGRAGALMRDAGRQRGVRRKVGLDDAVEGRALGIHAVHERAAIFVGCDEAAAHLAFAIQRRAQVGHRPVVIPRADAGLRAEGEFL